MFNDECSPSPRLQQAGVAAQEERKYPSPPPPHSRAVIPTSGGISPNVHKDPSPHSVSLQGFRMTERFCLLHKDNSHALSP